MYRHSGHLLLLTGVAAWWTAWTLRRSWPALVTLSTPAELAWIIAERTKELALANANLRESEARMCGVVDAAVDGIITIDERGTIESLNPAALRDFGYSAEELLGQNINVLMPSPYRDEHDNYLASYLRTGQREIIGIGREVVGRRKDGSTFPVDLSVSEVRLGERRIFTGIVRDITERKRAEEVLRKSEAHSRQLAETLEHRVAERTAELTTAEERFRGAFDAAAIGMALVAPDGRFLQVNDSLCGITGYSKDELLAMTFQEITYPDDLQADLDQAHAVLAGTIRSYRMEKRYFHKDGEIVWVMLSASLVRDADGRPSHFVAQIEDITPRKLAEEKLQDQTLLLESILDQLGDAVVVADQDGRFLILNQAARKLHGLRPTETPPGTGLGALDCSCLTA